MIQSILCFFGVHVWPSLYIDPYPGFVSFGGKPDLLPMCPHCCRLVPEKETVKI